jgi:hypothetical protein
VRQHQIGFSKARPIARNRTASAACRVGAGIACLIALLTLSHPALASDAGQVLTYNGECYVTSDGKRVKLSMGDAVHAGDVLEIPTDSKLKLQMADGSVLALGANSKMTIASYDVTTDGAHRDVKLNLDSGIVRAVVSKMSQQSTFEVSTATGVAAARSTDWFVEYQQATTLTDVSVLDGTVAFSGAGSTDGRGAVLIPPMSGSDIVGKQQPTAPQPRSQAYFAALIDRTDVRLGLCECLGNPSVTIKASCLDNVEVCKANCATAPYSFVPNAPESCLRMTPGTAVLPTTAK